MAAPAPAPAIKTVNFRGKPYVEVAERVKHVHGHDIPFEVIESDLLHHPQLIAENRLVWGVTILVNGKKYKGSAEVKLHNAKAGSADESNPFECAETSAIGRALAFAGYGTVEGIASLDEIARGMSPEEIAEGLSSAPVPATTPAPAPTRPTAPAAKPAPAPAAKLAPAATSTSAAAKATISKLSFNTAILPPIADADLEHLPTDAREVLNVIQADMGPYEFRAYHSWLNTRFGIPESAAQWTEAHVLQVAEKETEWSGLKDPIYGRAIWENTGAREDQIAQVNDLGKQFGSSNLAAFRDSIPELKGKATRTRTARQADKFLMLLRRVTQDQESGKLTLDEEGEALRNTLFSDLP